MNVARGLFRLWIVFSVIYIAAVAAIGFGDIKQEFEKASLDFSQFGTVLVPVDCSTARGRENTDFKKDISTAPRAVCWYEMPRFRALYPEYKDMAEKTVSDTLYSRAGIALNPAHPWETLGKFILIALIPPVIVFLIGWLLVWAVRGFSRATL